MKDTKISREQIKHIAELARLDLTEDEEGLMTLHINEILFYMDKLNEVDTSGVEPMHHAVEQVNVFREDKLRESPERSKLFANAPQEDGVFFIVPRVI